MSNVLNHINFFLKTYFGLEPPEVNFNLTKENSHYSVKSNTIYINPQQGVVSLFHEYSHALFTQQSVIGKENFEKLQELMELENKIGIQKDTKDFVLTPEIQEYLGLRKKFDNAVLKIYQPVQEGFALWMETKFCELAKIPSRESLFYQSKFYPFFQGFKADELNKGLFSTLYSFGFPFSTNPNHLTTFLGENVHRLDDYTFSVIYGSQKNDLDVLLVGGPVNRNTINQNGLDCLVASDTYLREKIGLLDIEVIDPLLTGDFLSGNPKEYYKAIESIPKPSHLTILHAREMCKVSLDHCVKFLQINHVPYALDCMAYALSYILSSKTQEKGYAPLFWELKENNPALRELVKISKKPFTPKEAKYVLENAKEEVKRLL